MLLQLALDKPEHFGVLATVYDLVDIVEIGTPLLKRFGLSAIATARQIAVDAPVLVDTKTVDGGNLEADMVFGAGATFMTVLSSATPATHDIVNQRAAQHNGWVVVDTINAPDSARPLSSEHAFPDRFAYVGVHSPTDARLAGDTSRGHIDAVDYVHGLGYRVSLAGGIGRDSLEQVLAVAPEILVIGGSITDSDVPRKEAEWIRNHLPRPNHGWPWDAR